jgi:hypothetical protein
MALHLLRWFVGICIGGAVVVVLIWGVLLVRAVNREEKNLSDEVDPAPRGPEP